MYVPTVVYVYCKWNLPVFNFRRFVHTRHSVCIETSRMHVFSIYLAYSSFIVSMCIESSAYHTLLLHSLAQCCYCSKIMYHSFFANSFTD